MQEVESRFEVEDTTSLVQAALRSGWRKQQIEVMARLAGCTDNDTIQDALRTELFHAVRCLRVICFRILTQE